jgi:hypothetical protein
LKIRKKRLALLACLLVGGREDMRGVAGGGNGKAGERKGKGKGKGKGGEKKKYMDRAPSSRISNRRKKKERRKERKSKSWVETAMDRPLSRERLT